MRATQLDRPLLCLPLTGANWDHKGCGWGPGTTTPHMRHVVDDFVEFVVGDALQAMCYRANMRLLRAVAADGCTLLKLDQIVTLG